MESKKAIESPTTTTPTPKIPLKLIKTFDKKLIVENWKEIKCGRKIKFKLGHYQSPNSFFIITDSSENFVLKNWMKKIEEFKALKSLQDFSIGNSCLVVVNGVNKRGKIHSINDQIKLLLVDFGEIIEVEKSSIFELPDELRALSFQAVHCSILGIKPKFNMSFWPSMQKSIIKNLIESGNWSMEIVAKNSHQHEFNFFGVNSYQVILIDIESGEFFHKIAVEKFFANSDKLDEDLELAEKDSDSDGELQSRPHN